MPGGYELTDMDVLKLQKMYGCDGACGGWAKSEDGGFSNEIVVLTFVCFFLLKKFECVGEISNVISGKLEGKNSDNQSPCEWILETSPGKVLQIFCLTSNQ